jgi:hypothetical protein
VLVLGAVVLHVSIGVFYIARSLAMSTSTVLVETFFSTGAPGSNRRGALRTTRRAGARTGTFFIGMVCLLASRALVVLPLALAVITALLAVALVTAIVKTIALVTAIIGIFSTVVAFTSMATSRMLATTTVVLVGGLGGLPLFLVSLLLDFLEGPGTNICRVICRESRNKLACVGGHLFVRLGIFLLPDASAGEESSLVELHGRGDGELKAEISARDEAEDR